MARTKDFDENEVLEKAMNIFWTRGYNSTSMEDLVTGLGISRSSLYDTYTDKHSLFIKTLENYQQISAAKIQEILSHSGTTRETVLQLIEMAIAGLFDGKQRKGCFMTNAGIEVGPYDKKVNKMICGNDGQMEEIFCQAIQKGQKNGEVKNPGDPRTLAKFFLNTIKGIQVTSKTASDKSLIDEIIKLAISTLDHR